MNHIKNFIVGVRTMTIIFFLSSFLIVLPTYLVRKVYGNTIGVICLVIIIITLGGFYNVVLDRKNH